MGASAGHLNQFLGSETYDCHDARSKRLRNRANYVNTIESFKRNPRSMTDGDHCGISSSTKLICRKRPLNEKEIGLSDFDVVSHQCGSVNDVLWIHKCGIRLNMQHMYIEHHGYCFDRVYSEMDDSERIFDVDIAPQLLRVTQENQQCCILAYGATGSGKTFTMEALSLLCAGYLLKEGRGLEVTCLEIARDTVCDLLGRVHARSNGTSGRTDMSSEMEVTLMDDENGATMLVGNVQRRIVRSLVDFARLQLDVAALRTTRVTGVHDHSSRSHLVLKMCIVDASVDSLPSGENTAGGILYLVDLAGSEWAQDQQDHDSGLIRESRDINSSLMVLKQCIKARIAHDMLERTSFEADSSESGPDTTAGSGRPAGGVVVAPYRDCKLTRVLKGCLSSTAHAVVVIGTVSPSSSDTEHSMATAANICRPSLEALRAQESIDASTAAAATTHSLNGRFFLISNVKGRALLNWDSDTSVLSGPGNADVNADPCTYSSNIATSESGSGSVTQWSAAQVCEWFVQAFGEVLEELNAASDVEAVLAARQQAGSVTVRLGAKQWVRLRLEGSGGENGDSIGLAFHKSAAQSTTVLKVLSKGYIKMLRMNTVRPGYRLIKVGSTRSDLRLKSAAPGADSRANLLEDLKVLLRAFKQVVRTHRAYDEARTRYLTPDMKILRQYVLNGQAPPLPAAGAEGEGEAEGEKSDSVTLPDPPPPTEVKEKTAEGNAATVASGEVEGSVLPAEPADMELILTFEKNLDPNTRYTVNNLVYFGGATVDVAAKDTVKSSAPTKSYITQVPMVPRIFTGESRTGEVWTGKELVEKYAEAKDGLNRMIMACDNNRLFGEHMHRKLLEMIAHESA